MMRFVLLDQSNGAKTTQGEVMTPALLTQIATAVEVQINRDFGTEYGGVYSVRAGASPTDIEASEITYALLSTLDDAPGAIAYHTVNGNGQPLLYDGITLSDNINGEGNSVSVAISHELLETAGDMGANLWAASVNAIYAREVCDPFESRSYQINGVWVSDFALNCYFDPGSPGPYSFMRKAGIVTTDTTAPLTTTNVLGYQMLASFDSQTIHQRSYIGQMKRRPLIHDGTRRAKRGLVLASHKVSVHPSK